MFAYGQTGTGKTHSMIGPPDDPGIIPRLLEEIFFAMDRDRSKQYLPLFFFSTLQFMLFRQLIAVFSKVQA